MASDGCREVEWKGQAFPYLMHRPDTRSHNHDNLSLKTQGVKRCLFWLQ
jgi:hypothetical protein